MDVESVHARRASRGLPIIVDLYKGFLEVDLQLNLTILVLTVKNQLGEEAVIGIP
jgi:hypothetical protein